MEWISPKGAAHRLNLSDARIQQLLRARRLRFQQTAIGRLIDSDSVEEYDRERKEEVQP